jgi:hypothetical protein
VLKATQTKWFEGLVRSLGGVAQLQMHSAQPDHMTIDIAFILDVTGSMTAWLEACKAQIKYIATEITPRITKQPEFEGGSLPMCRPLPLPSRLLAAVAGPCN